MAMLAALKHQSGRLPDLERQLRCDQTVGTTPNPIRTEIFAAHITPGIAQGFSSHPGKKPRTPAIMACRGYNTLGAKMASKNIMNHYRRSVLQLALNPLLTHAYVGNRTLAGRALALALEVKVAFRGRRLGDIDRVRSRKGLLQPLVQCLIEQTLLRAFGVFGDGAWSGHGCPPVGRPVSLKRCC